METLSISGSLFSSVASSLFSKDHLKILLAFINSNGKFFANVRLVYAYRFLHHHKPVTAWKLKQQNNLMDNGIDYYQVGTAGVRSAKAAVLNAKRKILSGLEKELKEQCKEHQ